MHAVDEPCFIVEPHAPGTKLISTGLPVFPLYYANDDDGQRRLGSDSRLTFTAPADGAYLVRVRDARGDGGDRYAYRLTVRPPEPDFNVRLSGGDPRSPPAAASEFTVSVDRIDGFEGEVRVDIAGLPEGFQRFDAAGDSGRASRRRGRAVCRRRRQGAHRRAAEARSRSKPRR